MNERAIMELMNILEGYTEPPGLDWPDDKKEQMIFSHWALEEILEQVWDHPWNLASETIEVFALKLETFAATAVTEDQRRMFAVAAETAWEILEDIEKLEK